MVDESRLAYRPNEAARVLGISRDLIFALLKDGSLKSFSVGSARLITTDALREFIRRREEEALP